MMVMTMRMLGQILQIGWRSWQVVSSRAIRFTGMMLANMVPEVLRSLAHFVVRAISGSHSPGGL